MLKIVLLLEALPWFTAGTIAARSDQDLAVLVNFEQMPTVLVFTLFFAGIAGLVSLKILVNNRLSVLFYARALNGFRALYVAEFPSVAKFLPTDPRLPLVPRRSEFDRFTFRPPPLDRGPRQSIKTTAPGY